MTFIISLGSNLIIEEAERNILGAISYMQGYFLPEEINHSSIYETAGVGSGAGKTYYNAVVKGETEKTYEEIHSTLKDLEQGMGRTPEACSQGIVPIDLDLLVLGDKIYKPKDLLMDYVTKGLAEL